MQTDNIVKLIPVIGLAQVAYVAVLDAKAGALRVCLGRGLFRPACVDVNSHTECVSE